jgi:hypothetical protein
MVIVGVGTVCGKRVGRVRLLDPTASARWRIASRNLRVATSSTRVA